MNLVYNVYRLRDPRDNRIRYIGVTKQKLSDRLTSHLHERASKPKTAWIQELLAEGLKPTIELLEQTTEDKAGEAEKRQIAVHRAEGHALLNMAEGGKGRPGAKVEPEAIAAFKKRMKALWQTPEYRSRVLPGLPERAAQKLTRQDAKQIRQLLSQGISGKSLASQFGVTTAAISAIKKGRIWKDSSYQPPIETLEEAYSSKLSWEKVRLIRQKLANGEVGIRIAEEFGIHPTMVARIKKGKAWREHDATA